MTNRLLTAVVLSAGLAGSVRLPALADGAASTRNILIGGAAAAAGTLLIINHNKQVHQRYADDARRQAAAQAQASNAQAAYAAERRAYDNEVAVNGEYRHEVATQHSLIVALRRQIALEPSRPRPARLTAHVVAPPPLTVRAAGSVTPPTRSINLASSAWGWGQL